MIHLNRYIGKINPLTRFPAEFLQRTNKSGKAFDRQRYVPVGFVVEPFPGFNLIGEL
ncbi:hypothetical protein [Spirosoma profusum]|uniref:hypothetical protein n=1 Tax=Spirosoma profusum TaxID=2771354 RepID=UPI0037433E03